MSLSYINTLDEWVDWPTVSPTSILNINVRFYTLTDDDNGSVTRLDLGRQIEEGIEGLYTVLKLHTRGITPLHFEQLMRDIVQTRLDTGMPYTIHTAMYAIMTGDTAEMRRLLRAEERRLSRTISLLPFKLYSELVDEPKGKRARLQYAWSYLTMRLRLLKMRIQQLFN